MKLRSGRTIVATPPSFGDDMNASLWGELQSFIDLSLIYAKLPLAPFFRLRQVCKEWNHLASNRQFLEQHFKPPISNLYFVVVRKRGHHLWTSSQDSSSWTSSPLPRRQCEVSGLLYEDSDRHRVFDLHTCVFYSLPPLPSRELMGDGSIVGMTVDTTLIPYGFRVVIIEAHQTNIYDSKSGAWTIPTPTSILAWTRTWALPSTLLSVYYKKFLYMLIEKYWGGGCYVLAYYLENHVWGYKKFGGLQRGSSAEWEYGNISVWRDHWFAFGMNSKWILRVWQMKNPFQELWTVFDCMPKELCKWMMKGLGHQNFLNTFCGEHVLVYNCLEVEERAVLYNLDQKTWNKVEVFTKKKKHVPK